MEETYDSLNDLSYTLWYGTNISMYLCLAFLLVMIQGNKWLGSERVTRKNTDFANGYLYCDGRASTCMVVLAMGQLFCTVNPDVVMANRPGISIVLVFIRYLQLFILGQVYQVLESRKLRTLADYLSARYPLPANLVNAVSNIFSLIHLSLLTEKVCATFQYTISGSIRDDQLAGSHAIKLILGTLLLLTGVFGGLPSMLVCQVLLFSFQVIGNVVVIFCSDSEYSIYMNQVSDFSAESQSHNGSFKFYNHLIPCHSESILGEVIQESVLFITQAFITQPFPMLMRSVSVKKQFAILRNSILPYALLIGLIDLKFVSLQTRRFTEDYQALPSVVSAREDRWPFLLRRVVLYSTYTRHLPFLPVLVDFGNFAVALKDLPYCVLGYMSQLWNDYISLVKSAVQDVDMPFTVYSTYTTIVFLSLCFTPCINGSFPTVTIILPLLHTILSILLTLAYFLGLFSLRTRLKTQALCYMNMLITITIIWVNGVWRPLMLNSTVSIAFRRESCLVEGRPGNGFRCCLYSQETMELVVIMLGVAVTVLLLNRFLHLPKSSNQMHDCVFKWDKRQWYKRLWNFEHGMEQDKNKAP